MLHGFRPQLFSVLEVVL